MAEPSLQQRIGTLEVPLDRDLFLRGLIRVLAGTLEEVIGLADASGFISVVGQSIGDEIGRDYRLALGAASLTRPQVAAVLVDLKRRIRGLSMSSKKTTKRSCWAIAAAPSGTR